MVKLSDALTRLYARVPFGVRLGLDGMLAACREAGNPERGFEAVHVAGTNGKGSVSAMVAAIARAEGLRVGLYTSPHLVRFAERIQIDGAPLADEVLALLLADTLDRAPELTFFEVATLAAFRAFREAGVDLAVLEVGLGGRLDATNVIPPPRAAAITRIAFDHTDRLGTTLDSIAREKAGILKLGVDVVVGPLAPESRRAVDDVARRVGATVTEAARDPDASGFLGRGRIGLSGAHQRDNAGVAYVLGKRIGATPEACARGIAGASWPGRLETVRTGSGDVLLDAAHNPDGVDSLVRYVDTLRRTPSDLAVVFGALADKAWAEMVDRVAEITPHRFYVRPRGRAAVDPAALAERQPGKVLPEAARALADARVAVGGRGLVVVCGSILLVGEVRGILLDLARDPPVGL